MGGKVTLFVNPDQPLGGVTSARLEQERQAQGSLERMKIPAQQRGNATGIPQRYQRLVHRPFIPGKLDQVLVVEHDLAVESGQQRAVVRQPVNVLFNPRNQQVNLVPG
ncbi:hypothetical protein D3C73_1064140 [compost metagenome]